jgi:hypothetical protein
MTKALERMTRMAIGSLLLDVKFLTASCPVRLAELGKGSTQPSEGRLTVKLGSPNLKYAFLFIVMSNF